MIEKLSNSKKSSADKKHRIYEVIQSIKDAIYKRKFNQAWDYASKYYQQNKNSLQNEQIYQLCWLSCESINKKIHLRLTSSPKSYQLLLNQNHFEHLFSLFLSSQAIFLPQIISKDHKYFDMLAIEQSLIHPKVISPHDLVFQRKSSSYFLNKQQIKKQLKRFVKQHLKIVNNTLMYKVKTKKQNQEIIQAIKCAQQIFDSFQQHEFPIQTINFQLIKLSIIQDLAIKENIKCQYRFPLGLVNKIFHHMRNNRQQAIQHYIKKLNSYLVLSFRHLPISIQDMIIVCQQMLFIVKLMTQKSSPPLFFQNLQSKKKLCHLKLNRQITIQKDHIEDDLHKSVKSKISSCFSTNNKFSQKKLESKTRLFKPEGQLRSIASMALQKINGYLNARKQLTYIILSYFSQFFFKSIKNNSDEQIISNEVILQTNKKSRKNSCIKQEDQVNKISKNERKNHRSLTSLLNEKGLRKKVSIYDENEEKQVYTTNFSNKKEAKFICRNISNIKKQKEISDVQRLKISRLLNNIKPISSIEMIDQSSSDEQGKLNHTFQRRRKEQIKNINKKYSIKHKKQPKTVQRSYSYNEKLEDEQIGNNLKNGESTRLISLLDDVVNATINEILQLPKIDNKNTVQKNKGNIVEKLQNLKRQAEDLNLERRLLVQRLYQKNQSNSLVRQDIRDSVEQKLQNINANQEYIYQFTQKLKEKTDSHIAKNSKLLKLEKENKFKINFQPKIKLQLEKGKRTPELTFQKLEQQYKKYDGSLEVKKQVWDMMVSCQFDRLRRDISKNQFASQNEKKNNFKKSKCQTILQKTYDDEIDEILNR